MAPAFGARARCWRARAALLPPLWLAMMNTMTGCATPKKPAIAPTAATFPGPTSAVQPLASAEPRIAASIAAPAPNQGDPAPSLGPISSKTTPKTDATWAACYQKLKSRGVDPARDVATLASACQAATKMKLVGSTIVGKQSASDPPQSYPLRAEAEHCYRVYGQADLHIEDLHLAIEDSAGIVAAQDSTATGAVIASRDGAVCFKESDTAAVVVSVGRGGGTYALQVWGD